MPHQDAHPGCEDLDPASYIAAARRCKQSGHLEEAFAILGDGIRRCPPSPSLYAYYIERLEKCNRTEEALAAARRAVRLFPDDLLFQLWEALMLPVVYATSAELENYRQRYWQGLRRVSDNLLLDTPEARKTALAAVGRYVNVHLGFQGGNVRDSQTVLGGLLQRIMSANYPHWTGPLPMPAVAEDGSLRIGYISSCFFESSSAMKNHLGWLREHASQFTLHTYYVGRPVDSVTDDVRRMSYSFQHFPNALEEVARAILADRLHVLVYLDIGLRPVMSQLASLRLAPIQCATWEAPYSSGLPSIDYFISSDLMEPEDAQGHYSEQLIRLPGVGICYRKPVIPAMILTKTRREFGLRDDAAIYLCCQAAPKYLPDDDDLFWRIAKQAPNAQFVFLAPNRFLADDLRKRLYAAFAAGGLDASHHVVILPGLPLLDYWNLHLVSDVFLDTIGWSGGVSTFEAIACGLPVVTMPGNYMRGRHSYAILTQLGVTETIARCKDEYVSLAVRLAIDRAWRQGVMQRMIQGHSRLYSDTRCVRALEEFFRIAVEERLVQEESTQTT